MTSILTSTSETETKEIWKETGDCASILTSTSETEFKFINGEAVFEGPPY